MLSVSNLKASSFFYIVNQSQLPRGREVDELHLQSWSQIFGVPPEPEASKFLVTDRPPGEYLDYLCSIWTKNISGPEARVLKKSHEEAQSSVQQAIESRSQMVVRLRMELLEPLPLRKTTVGRHYVNMLKTRIRLLESGNQPRWKLWKRLRDPDDRLTALKTELRHWKKCKVPQKCRRCLLI
jgi:hypothetical protein